MEKETFMKLNKKRIFPHFMERFKNSYLSYFLMYNFYYLSWALFSSFISVYLLDKGFRPSDVSLVVSASFLASMIFQPIIGILSDRFSLKLINTILFALAGLGGIYFVNATRLIELIIGYSFVLTLINGTNPIMERIATTSPYPYGRIRIWGTIGYALGSQLAGLIYDFVSPSAIFVTFVFTMAISIIGLLGTSPHTKVTEKDENEHQDHSFFKAILTNKKYIYYLLISAIFFGVTNMGHTFTPAYFQSEGLNISTVSIILSLAVVCEAPIVLLSYKFMDKIANKKLMILAFCMVITLYSIYAFNLWLPLQVIATFIVKHPAGMLFIMINLKVVNTLVDAKYQITALAFVQTCRNLSSVIFQNIGGQILNVTTYQNMFLCALGVITIGLIMTVLFKIPAGNDKGLFN
ncbi:MFS transporter [Beduini massiliensis]|uniref:MFS transporter n=1 Tax=Beduini massiliensis TaxID=1585974 RepID=UPI000A4C4FDE|nr:MFS transporter [Beduini massiliensis]